MLIFSASNFDGAVALIIYSPQKVYLLHNSVNLLAGRELREALGDGLGRNHNADMGDTALDARFRGHDGIA
jgi:hypothetical protein